MATNIMTDAQLRDDSLIPLYQLASICEHLLDLAYNDPNPLLSFYNNGGSSYIGSLYALAYGSKDKLNLILLTALKQRGLLEFNDRFQRYELAPYVGDVVKNSVKIHSDGYVIVNPLKKRSSHLVLTIRQTQVWSRHANIAGKSCSR